MDGQPKPLAESRRSNFSCVHFYKVDLPVRRRRAGHTHSSLPLSNLSRRFDEAKCTCLLLVNQREIQGWE
jgi:hypothetical protein